MSNFIAVTELDSRRLQSLIDTCRRGAREAGSAVALERHLDEAEVVPAERVDPDLVTMNSEVRVRDLDSQQTLSFRLVFPRAADAEAGRISVLAPLGMAVLGRRRGDRVTWQMPGGRRRLLVESVLFQPEREGKDVA
jgi:regulator of nucleoside diphosphate kinase